MEEEGFLRGGFRMNGKRVWLYCRVASRENSVELLEAQKPILEDYAKEHGLEIVGCSSDVGSVNANLKL